MTETGPPLSKNDVERFESRYHVAFPKAYREFLLRSNGGRPELNAFSIHGFEYGSEGCIQVFYAIDDPVESCSLEWQFAIVKQSLPDQLLPIASDGGGNKICIAWYGDREGQVFFWHFHDMPHEADWTDVYFVAEDFDSFFRGLRYPTGMDEIEMMLKMNDLAKLKVLLESGYDIHKPNEYDRTLLEEAACANRPEMIQILFDHGAKLRHALRWAKDNLEFFPEYKQSVDLIRKLQKERPN